MPTAFNDLLGADTLRASIAYITPPHACAGFLVCASGLFCGHVPISLNVFWAFWSLIVTAYFQYLRQIVLTSNIFEIANAAGWYYQPSSAGHVLAVVTRDKSD